MLTRRIDYYGDEGKVLELTYAVQNTYKTE